jgi:hypothetical protein
MNKNTINIIVGIAIIGIIFYLSETNTTLALLAGAGILYLVFANKLVHVAV